MREIPAELMFRLRTGPFRVAAWLVDRLFDQRRDRRFGISTSGSHPSHSKSQDFVHYQPVSYRDLEESLALASITPNDVFLDIGSGMGRALCVAATQPLRRVVGVEISSELCTIAEHNVSRIRYKAICPDIQIVNADALDYSIPADVSLIFLFNPLTGAALRTLLERIVDSHQKHPRELRILFTGTISAERFAAEAAQHGPLGLVRARTLSTGAKAFLYNVQDQR